MLLIWSCRWWLLQKKSAIKIFREKCLVMGLLNQSRLCPSSCDNKSVQNGRNFLLRVVCFSSGGVLFLSSGCCNMQKLFHPVSRPGVSCCIAGGFFPIYPRGPFFRPCKSERCWTVITYMKRQADKPSQIRQLNVTQWWWAIHNVFWWSGKHLTSSPQKRLDIHD